MGIKYPDFEVIGQNLNGCGFYFPDVFTPIIEEHYPRVLPSESYYTRLHAAHQFQDLTESNKPGVSYRKGVYLSRVQSDPASGDLTFNLLRCSTNFQHPTENFRDVDEEIIDVAQRAADHVYDGNAELNHVLAQVYYNTAASTTSTDDGDVPTKEKKARIKSHSDKTKDMPHNGMMAFCTFYSDDIAQKAKVTPEGDYVYKHGSVLTKLRWKLKPSVPEYIRLDRCLKDFDVLLHPNSLLLVPLDTNMLYTHEIVPPQLPVERVPTRLGYVIRCSNGKAVSRGGQTYVDGRPLVQPTNEQVQELRALYYEENCSADMVEYGKIDFSMNAGDYMPPVL